MTKNARYLAEEEEASKEGAPGPGSTASLTVNAATAVCPMRTPKITQEIIDGNLTTREKFWRDQQPWLKAAGYMLRARYQPDWVPSWVGTNKFSLSCEDGISPAFTQVMDATRTTDKKAVGLKVLSTATFPFELSMVDYLSLSTSELRESPQNHCVPVYETFSVPNDPEQFILVMPFLREALDPHFETIGEAIDVFHQIFEDIKFMHDHRVAHRDCCENNMMFDPSGMYPDLYHPVRPEKRRDFNGKATHYSRTQRPPKYYLIDFGLSRRYEDDISTVVEPVIVGGDRTAPEHAEDRGATPCNPFQTDVYYIGNMVREEFIRKTYNFQFMAPLIRDMVQDDMAKRPTMDEVMRRFDGIVRSLSELQLRSRVAYKDQFPFLGPIRDLVHWTRQARFKMQGLSAIPTPWL